MTATTLITGASSGIGWQLALELARRGRPLALAARRREKLDALAAEISAADNAPAVSTHALDVNDEAAVVALIGELADSDSGLDTVIANAGIAGGGAVGSGKLDEDLAIIRTNVIGAMTTIDTAVSRFRRQGHGHVVAVSSVAALRGMPGAGAYCASKAALATYMQALEAELYHTDLHTTTLFPGYIDTPLNDMMKNRPFLIDATKGARIIADLIDRKVTRSTVPVYPWNIVGRLLKWAPTRALAPKPK